MVGDGGKSSGPFDGEGVALFLPHERDLPAFLRENPEDVFGSGGRGASLWCLSWGVLQSS